MSISPGAPADFSFNGIRHLDSEKFLSAIGLEGVRYTRVGGVPDRGPEKRFLTKSLWLNNNKLKSTRNIHELVNATIEYPAQLGWIDFSFNYITEIEEQIVNLDFTPIVKTEKLFAMPPEVIKKFKEEKEKQKAETEKRKPQPAEVNP
ncbi:hypothetical protein YQE_08611, partial [Dendroctonus ponderosae]